MNQELTLDQAGECAPLQVVKVGGVETFRRRLLQMGITPGARIEILRRAPLSGPIEVRVRGAEIALRQEDCRNIAVEQA